MLPQKREVDADEDAFPTKPCASVSFHKSRSDQTPNRCEIVQSISTTVYAGGGLWLKRRAVVVVGTRQEFASGQTKVSLSWNLNDHRVNIMPAEGSPPLHHHALLWCGVRVRLDASLRAIYATGRYSEM